MPVSLPAYRASGATDDRAALAAALAVAIQTDDYVHLPAGQGTGPGGEYLIDTFYTNLNLPSKAKLHGDGIDQTKIRYINSSANGMMLIGDSGSPDVAHNLTGITIRDLTMEDTSQAGLEEGLYMIALSGASDVLIDHVKFRGFRSDAIYLGSSIDQFTERHNQRVVIKYCIFDGINKQNRNAISIIDGDDVTIQNCEFVNCTPDGDIKPGPIDLEPNDGLYPILRNIKILDCEFIHCGGNAVSMLLRSNNPQTLTNAIQNISVERCTIECCTGAFSFFGYQGNEVLSNWRPYNVTFKDSTIRHTSRPFLIDGAYGVSFSNNTVEYCDRSDFGLTATNREVTVSGNRFVRCGYNGEVLRHVTTSTGISIESNTFTDCGQADDDGQGFIFQLGSGDIELFKFNYNNIENLRGTYTGITMKVGGYSGAINTPSIQEVATWSMKRPALRTIFLKVDERCTGFGERYGQAWVH